MPVTGFSVTDTGALAKAECDHVPSLMIIAGPNGVGKSTLLDELNQGITRSRNWVDVDGDVDAVYLSPHRAPLDSDFSTTLLTSLDRTSSRFALAKRTYRISSNEAPRSVRTQNQRTRKTADFAPYFEVKKRLAQFEFDKGQLLSEIYDNHGEVPRNYLPDFHNPLKSAIDTVLPGIEYLGVTEDDNEYKIYFRDKSGKEVEFDDLSSGEKDAITMCFLLVERQTEDLISSVQDEEGEEEDLILLIDSPEAYLHPAMQERFLTFLQETVDISYGGDVSIQIILCTHSRSILENADNNEIYFLLYQDQREENQLVNAEEISTRELERVFGELGITALSAGNPLVLVEGKSDREYLRKMFPEFSDKVEIIPLGGKGNIIGLNYALNKLIPELYTSGIYLFAMLDGDRDLNVEDDYSGFVFKFPVACIENFLLDPRALYESLTVLIGETSLEERGYTSSEDFDNIVKEVIESGEFQDREVRKRLNEELSFYIRTDNINDLDEDSLIDVIDEVTETKKKRIVERLTSVKEEVDQSVRNGNFDQLNGKLIMSEIANIFGVSREKLARLTAVNIVQVSNQPDDLIELIEEIDEIIESEGTPQTILEEQLSNFD